jgi:ATP-dependent DNA ligase
MLALTLFSRRDKSLNRNFPYIVDALADLPAGTVVDGEVVAIDDSGRPDFNSCRTSEAQHRGFTTTYSTYCAARTVI